MITDEKREDRYDEVRHDIGLCGCGNPEEVEEMVVKMLALQDTLKNSEGEEDYEKAEKSITEYIKSLDPNIIREYILHTFEKAGLVEHAFTINNSCLTDKGREFVELAKENASGRVDV